MSLITFSSVCCLLTVTSCRKMNFDNLPTMQNNDFLAYLTDNNHWHNLRIVLLSPLEHLVSSLEHRARGIFKLYFRTPLTFTLLQLFAFMGKRSLRFGIFTIPSICAKGDKRWCHWQSISDNGNRPYGINGAPHRHWLQWRSPLHWWSIDLIKWLHWRHYVAMCLPQSPMIVNSVNDVIGANGNIGDPLLQMVIHWCRWRHWRHECQWC